MMLKTLIIYDSKYNTTKDISKVLSLILGPSKITTPDDFKEEYKNFDFYIIGTPIYYEKPTEKISNFIKTNSSWLKRKRVSLFASCLSKDGGKYLYPFRKLLGKNAHIKAIGGKININDLNKVDRSAFKSFCSNINIPFKDITLIKDEDIVEFALELKEIRDSLLKKMPKKELLEHVEKFLHSHNTLSLATGNKNNIRSTPIEYIYDNGYIYILTEGGEKFSNLILNTDVALSIYEPFTSMDTLKGMQIKAKAYMIKHLSKEYEKVLNLKGLNLEKILKLPVKMNIIKIKILKVEFINSDFKSLGYDVKQIM